jgi:DNA-binding NarL/FixJ family response regulator
MTEEQLGKKMLEDAKKINNRFSKRFALNGRKQSHIEPHMKQNPAAASKPPPITKGDGWRNSKLTKKEISDIEYFLDRGWCASSTAKITGVSVSTVQKYKSRWNDN